MNKFGSAVLKKRQTTLSHAKNMASPLRKAMLAALATWGVAAAVHTAVAAPAASASNTATPQGAPIQLALVESLSGPFANTGEAVFRNILMAAEQINADGGVKLPAAAGGARVLQLRRYDSKGQNEEALSALRAAIDGGARVIMQGNSSATASALLDAINKHNQREPNKRVLFLNYSAVDPAFTNERCSFWHFRFDAHADMRMAALMQEVKADKALKNVYLIGQDYSFGQAVLGEARRQLAAQRPDVSVVGNELHPVGRVKDFAPYVAKIKHSGAQAVITGNWGNDLTLLVKAAREAGFDGMFYTFYGNALGAPAALGDAGVGKVVAVADWLPNTAGAASEQFYQRFRQRFPKPEDDYAHLRMQMMVQALAQSMEKAGSTEAAAVAHAMENVQVELAGRKAYMRAADHQFQQPLEVGVMERQGSAGVKFDVEGSGYGFRVVRDIAAKQAELPTTCQMKKF